MYRPFAKIDQVIKEKKIPIRYPRGYQQWKKKFDRACQETRGDVCKALEKVHGVNFPGGTVSPEPPTVPPKPSAPPKLVE